MERELRDVLRIFLQITPKLPSAYQFVICHDITLWNIVLGLTYTKRSQRQDYGVTTTGRNVTNAQRTRTLLWPALTINVLPSRPPSKIASEKSFLKQYTSLFIHPRTNSDQFTNNASRSGDITFFQCEPVVDKTSNSRH